MVLFTVLDAEGKPLVVNAKTGALAFFDVKADADKYQKSLGDKAEGTAIQGFRVSQTVVI